MGEGKPRGHTPAPPACSSEGLVCKNSPVPGQVWGPEASRDTVRLGSPEETGADRDCGPTAPRAQPQALNYSRKQGNRPVLLECTPGERGEGWGETPDNHIDK